MTSPLPAAYDELRNRLAEVSDIARTAGLAAWDQRTKMPPAAAPVRAEQLGTLTRLAHERFVSDEIGRLLDELRAFEESADPDSEEASLIRVTRRDYEKLRKVPPQLRSEMSRAGSVAQSVWEQARKNSDFASFLPYLERNIEL